MISRFGRPCAVAFVHVVDGGLVEAHTHDHGAIQRSVRMSVSASVEPMASGTHSGGSGDGASSTQLGEGGLGTDSLGVVSEHGEHRGGGIGTDTESIAQSGSGGGGELVKEAVVRGELLGQREPAPGEGPQRMLGRFERGVHRSAAGESAHSAQ